MGAWRESCEFRESRLQPGSCLPGTFLRLVALPDEERRGDLAVADLATAMNERGKAHGTQSAEGNVVEMALFMSGAQGQGEDFFGEPAIEQAKLGLVGDMFEVVVDKRDIADALRQGVLRGANQKFGALARAANTGELGALAAERDAEDVADFAEFVAGEPNAAAGLEFEAEMVETAGRLEAGRGNRRGKSLRHRKSSRVAGQKHIVFVRGLAAKMETLESRIERADGLLDGLPVVREEKQIVGVAEVVDVGDGFDLAVERGQVEIGEKASDWSTEGDALRGAGGRGGAFVFFLIGEPYALFQEAEQIVAGIDPGGKLRQEQLVADGREVVGNIAFSGEERRRSGCKDARDLALAAIQAIASEPVGIRVS